MDAEMNSMKKDITQIRRDMEIIKEVLLARGGEIELTDWAKKELKKAREEKEYTDLDEL